MKLSQIEENIQIQEEGEWKDLGDADEGLAGVEVCIRSTRSEVYEKRLRHLQDQIKLGGSRRRAGTAIAKAAEKEREALAVLVADWRHIEDEDGNPIPYSESKCREWVSDRRYRRFFDAIFSLARDIGIEETEEREEILGNSESESSTSSGHQGRRRHSAREERAAATATAS